MDTLCTREASGRKTNADKVFEALKVDIVKMRLPPGSKLSEADLAARFGLSRQPVREALIRLDYLRLVRIQAQRATTVRKISRTDMTHSRFARLSIELEMARQATAYYEGEHNKAFSENLRQQRECMKRMDLDGFSRLDYDFHHLISRAARAEFAFQSIVEAMIAVDRLCALSFKDKRTMKQIYDDHRVIFKALSERDEESMISAVRQHLGRIDHTLGRIQMAHPEYFAD